QTSSRRTIYLLRMAGGRKTNWGRVQMMTSDPIVVGTDGSPSAQLAVDRAGDLAQARGAGLHVGDSYSAASGGPWMAAGGGLAVAEMPAVEEAQSRAEEIVGQARQDLERRGIGARAHVCTGDPADALITVAADMHAQMIVVGNRGMTGARRVLGSVPNRVS